MGIYKGLTNVSKIYKGSTVIQKVYKGTTLIYNNISYIIAKALGKNHIDITRWLEDTYIDPNNGNFTAIVGGRTSHKIYVEPDTTYYVATDDRGIVRFEDENESYIGVQGTLTGVSFIQFTTPVNCRYVYVYYSRNGTDVSDVQMELGTSPTTYEAWTGYYYDEALTSPVPDGTVGEEGDWYTETEPTPDYPPVGYTQVTDFASFLTALSLNVTKIAFDNGNYSYTQTITSIPNGSSWVGQSRAGVIHSMNGYYIDDSNVIGFEADTMTFKEGQKIVFQGSSDLTFKKIDVLDMTDNGIVLYICTDMLFDDCLFDNMGTDNRDPTVYTDYTTLGAGIRATTPTNLEVKNCEFTHIRSQGGIYLYNSATNFNIHHNYFHHTCFRGVHMFSGSVAYSGYIDNNQFYDMGNGDGVCAEGNIECAGGTVNAYGYGCNAIYSQTAVDMNIYIRYNDIRRCYENFIETRCIEIRENYMEKSGYDIANHASRPIYNSHEGIYSSEAHIIDNEIVDAGGGWSTAYPAKHQAAIRWDAGYGTIDDYIISGNIIRCTAGYEVDKPCIKLNCGTSGIIRNSTITNNIMTGYSSAYNLIAGTQTNNVKSGNTLDGIPVD